MSDLFQSLLTGHYPAISIPLFLTENVLLISAVAGILLTCLYMLKKDTRKLPPCAKTGYSQTISIFMAGKPVPAFMLTNMRELGSVFRLNMPEMVHFVSICDAAFARKILLEEDEKPYLYKRFEGFSNGKTTTFSSRTHGENWGAARKNLAQCFSMKSICTTLPKMYEKIEEMKKMLLMNEKDGKTIEVSDLTTRLTMDFICAGNSVTPHSCCSS